MRTNKINILLFFIILSTLSCSNNDLEFENNNINESFNKVSSIGNDDDNNPFNTVTITDYIVNIEFDKNFVGLEDLDRISQEIIYGGQLSNGIFYPGVILNLIPSSDNPSNPYIKSWIVTVSYFSGITPTGGIGNNVGDDPRVIIYTTEPTE